MRQMGSTFSELRLKEGYQLPLSCCVEVSASNERVLRSFLGLAAQVIQPTGPQGEDFALSKVLVPPGLSCKMLSTVPIPFANGPSTLQQPLGVEILEHEIENIDY